MDVGIVRTRCSSNLRLFETSTWTAWQTGPAQAAGRPAGAAQKIKFVLGKGPPPVAADRPAPPSPGKHSGNARRNDFLGWISIEVISSYYNHAKGSSTTLGGFWLTSGLVVGGCIHFCVASQCFGSFGVWGAGRFDCVELSWLCAFGLEALLPSRSRHDFWWLRAGGRVLVWLRAVWHQFSSRGLSFCAGARFPALEGWWCFAAGARATRY